MGAKNSLAGGWSRRSKWLRITLRILIWLVLVPPVLLALLAGIILLPGVQDRIRSEAVVFLEERIGTPVKLERLALHYPIGVGLKGLLVVDQQHDTLLYAGKLVTRLSLTGLFDKRIALSGTALTDVRAVVLQEADSSFNFSYIIDAFADGTKPPTPKDTTGGWAFSMSDITLERIRADVILRPAEMDLRLDLGELEVDLDEMDAAALLFHADDLRIADTRVDMRMAPGPSKPDPYPKRPPLFAGLDIFLDALELDRVSFTMKNTITNDSLWIAVMEGELEVEESDLDHQRIHLSLLALTGAEFGMLNSDTTLADTVAAPSPPWLDQHDGFRYYLRGLDIAVDRIALSDGAFNLHRGSVSTPAKAFDPDHLVFHKIVLDANDVVVNDQHVAIGVDEFSADDGIHAEPITAAFRLDGTPSALQLFDGRFDLNGLPVQVSAQANFGSMDAAYREPRSVPIQARVTSKVDLAKLPELLRGLGLEIGFPDTMTETWDVDVRGSGTVAVVDSLRLSVNGDQGSRIDLRAQAKDVTAWPKTSFKVDLGQVEMGSGMRDLVVAFTPEKTPVPMRFSGMIHAQGTGTEANATLDIRSDMADINGTISVAGITEKIPDALHADLKVLQADLPRITGNTTLGKLDLSIVAECARLNSSDRVGAFEVIPSGLRFQGQDLSGSRITGELRGDSVFAEVHTDAQAFAVDLLVAGRWPGESDSIVGAVDLSVVSIALREMGWMPHPLNVHGRWHGAAAFSTQGKGEFRLWGDSVRITDAERTFAFEEFKLHGLLTADSTVFEFDSDALKVQYHTNVPTDSLMPWTRQKLISFFEPEEEFKSTPGKRMDLLVELPKTEWLTEIVLPELHDIELRELSGAYDSDADALRLRFDLSRLNYGGIRISELDVNIQAQGNSLNVTSTVDSVLFNEFHVDRMGIVAVSAPGLLNTSLRVLGKDDEVLYSIPVQFQRSDKDIALRLGEELILDGSTWTADPKNLLRFTENGPVAEQFALRSDGQRIELITATNKTALQLDNFRIGSIFNIVSTMDSAQFVAGKIDGEVTFPLQDAAKLTADLRVSDLSIIGQRLGDLAVKARETAEQRYSVDLAFENGPNELDANAVIDLSDSSPSIDAKASIGLTDLTFARPFVGAILYELSGGLKGDVQWSLRNGDMHTTGDLTFLDAHVGVIYTGATYTLKHERIRADAEGFEFKKFTLLDTLGNAFTLDGDVFTKDLSTMRFDLRIRTDSFQLMNSEADPNALIYGDLIAGMDLRVTGTDLSPVVKGDVSILPGTDLSLILPGSEIKMVSHEGIVEFTTDLDGGDTSIVATDEEMLRDSIAARLPKLDMTLNIRVDKRAAFAVVLDPTTGDQATVKGEGDLRFQYAPDGDITLSGPFTIAEGGYTLEFYGLVKKRFDLVAGSTIVWDGDPVGATMDLKAQYIARSAAYPLVSNSTGGLSESARNRLATKMPFEVIINIGGKVKDPDISFGIDLDEEYRNSYPQVNEQLERLAEKSREDERNKQVFGLLVMNSFIEDEASGGGSSSGIVSNAARNSVTGILTNQLNKLTGRYIKGVDIQLGVNSVDQVEGSNVYQRTSVDYKVSKSFLDDRLSFEVGGSVGVDNRDEGSSNVSNTRAAQYAIVYDLTEDGRYRLRGFHENAFDLYDGEITNSGVAIQFTRDLEENERAREARREELRLEKEAEEKAKRKQKNEEENEDDPKSPPKKEEDQ